MKKIFAFFVSILLFGVVIVLCYANYRLFKHPKQGGNLGAEAIETLRALKKPMQLGAPTQMQSEYPEGYVFMHALYALAWCNAVRGISPDQPLHQEAVTEIGLALQALDSEEARQIFNAGLPLSFGAYYRGWTAYVQGQYLTVVPNDTLVKTA